MKWNQDQSVKLSQVCIALFMVALVILSLFSPRLLRQFILFRGEELRKLPLFLATVYSTALPALLVLTALWRMLKRIGRGEVFVQENVTALRMISWCCMAAGAIYLVSSLYYVTYFLLGLAGTFMGLILRVVKNVFAEALEIKLENDYTI